MQRLVSSKAERVTPGDKWTSTRGFTLLELIMVITVAAIVLPSVLIPFTTGMRRGDRPEIYAIATYLAQERMELLEASSFDSLTPLGSWVNETAISLNGRTYDRKYLVQWASSSMQTDDDDDPDEYDDDGDGVSPSQTYKKITVTVSNSKISDVTLTTGKINPIIGSRRWIAEGSYIN